MHPTELIANKLTKFGITSTEEENTAVLLEVDQSIKNYCRIDEIPKDLLFTRVNMAVDYIRYQHASKPLENGALDTSCTQKVGPLTLISSGDVTYQFGSVQASKTNVVNAHETDLDEILLNYTKQLNVFRRLL